jgi:hypothetical protein
VCGVDSRSSQVVARQAANVEAASKRKVGALAESAPPGLLLQAQLIRLLRPKARRWAMYEWFYSPVDFGWFRHKAFLELLQVVCRVAARHSLGVPRAA